uniref:F-box protein n=1 Tax=Noccaea caerulescens TaxID=107243 RepID=A0A1J3CY13_NOCCA
MCFDFTAERFAPRLPLPFTSCCHDAVSLSSVREEQLVVLFQSSDTLDLEIWVTTKIESEPYMEQVLDVGYWWTV